MKFSAGSDRVRVAQAAALCLGAVLMIAGCGDSPDGQGAGTVQEKQVDPGNSSGAALSPEETTTGAGAKRGE